MCGVRSGLVGAFDGVERFVRQGAYGADLSLYEVDVVLEEYGRVGIVWLSGGKRRGRWMAERRHWGRENKVKVIL